MLLVIVDENKYRGQLLGERPWTTQLYVSMKFLPTREVKVERPGYSEGVKTSGKEGHRPSEHRTKANLNSKRLTAYTRKAWMGLH